MLRKPGVASLAIVFSIILLFASCATTRTAPISQPQPDTYVLEAPTGDIYVFKVLPKDKKESEDEVVPRPTRKITAFAIQPELKWSAPSYDENDFFCGSIRAECKTSINNVHFESFPDLNSFLETLPSDSHMRTLGISSNSNRSNEEKRNVTINRTYIYAIKHEGDKDYHLIIGDSEEETFINVEISGLPDEHHADFDILLSVRQTLKNFLSNARLRESGSYNVPDKPIPVSVSGSLFFDFHPAVGPKKYSTKTSWEIHPVSKIEFLRR